MRGKHLPLPAILAGALLAVLSCTLMGMAAIPASPSGQRSLALQRWLALRPHSYRVVVQASFSGRSCLQEVEVHGDETQIVHDTCGSSWLSTLAVPRLFELGQRLEHPSECFPSKRTCICQRTRVGEVSYDGDFGFPGRISWRRELRPNWQDPAYLARLLETRSLPNCSSPSRTLRLTVISLTPLP